MITINSYKLKNNIKNEKEIEINNGSIAISDVTLLLPHTITQKNEVHYKLEAYNSCFKWISSNPEIIKVEPIFESIKNENISKECSTSAYVTACTQGTSFTRSSTWILVEDLISGAILKCEIFVDWIHSIEIQTTTRVISKDDLLLLQIQAFDNQGNVFSSVQGLEFQWDILQNINDIANFGGIIKFVPFKEAKIEIDKQLLEMEQLGLETSSILVQGINTGKVKITSRLSELGYLFKVQPANITLLVLESIQLKPSYFIYITPGTQIYYQLEKFVGDSIISIKIPNPQFIWSVDNQTVANIDNDALLTALSPGVTDIQVQYSTVFVVFPGFLSLNIISKDLEENITKTIPFSTKWYLIENQEYKLQILVHDREGHQIYTTDYLKFDVTLSNENIKIIQSSSNKAIHTIFTQKIGETEIQIFLKELNNPKINYYFELPYSINLKHQLIITPPVHIQPSKVSLPFHPTIKHQFSLQGIGGSGEYFWHSTNSNIISVNMFGKLTVQGKGEVKIILTDKKNPLNKDSIIVKSSNPSRIQFIPTFLEIEVGKILNLPIALWDEYENIFDNCSEIPFEWEISDTSIFSFFNEEVKQQEFLHFSNNYTACTIKSLRALKPGHSIITVSFGKLQTEITIFCFNRLEILNPKSNFALVTLGTTIDIIFTGGPNPWHQDLSAYQALVIPSNPNVIHLTKISSINAIHSLQITCLEHHKQNITISLGNQPTINHPYSLMINKTIEFSCQFPSFLYFFPLEKQKPKKIINSTIICPNTTFPTIDSLFDKNIQFLSNKYQIRNNRIITFNVTVQNENGKYFDNFSSLIFEWSTSNNTLLSFITFDSISRIVNISSYKDVVILEVRATRFDKQILLQSGIKYFPSLPKNLKRTLELNLIPNVKLFPSKLTIYNHEKNYVRLISSEGSGNHLFFINNTKIAQILHNETGSQFVEIIPLYSGTVEVSVIDICLGGSEISKSIITISDISSVILKVNDMVKLGQYIPLEVETFDQNNQLFEIEQYKFMNFSFQIDNSVVTIEKSENNRTYYVKGSSLGIAHIILTLKTRTGIIISSKPIEIYVYPSLKLIPKQLTLLPGTYFQIQWNGGPPLRSDISFKIENLTIVTIDKLGMMEAKEEGITRLYVIIQATDLLNQDKIIYEEDFIDIIVKKLTGIRIHTATTNILSGNEIIMRVIGLQGETPFSFGTHLNIYFKWEVEDDEIILLKPIYEETNNSLNKENGFSIRAFGKHAGTTKITVHIISSPLQFHIQDFTASVQITVIESLKLLTPHHLFLLPNSKFQLKTNKDKLGILNYQILENLRNNPIIDLDCNGLIITKGIIGKTFILISEEGIIPQSMVVEIEIKSIQFLQLSPKPPIHFEIPLGSLVEFKALLKDDLGNIFSSYDNILFDIQLNRIDFISARLGTNGTIFVKALSPGDTILRTSVINSDSKLEDYILIRVGHIIFPVNPIIHIGGRINFSMSESFISDKKGEWFSDNPRIFTINPFSGEGIAHEVGKTKIYFNNTLYTYTYVTVVKVGKIVIDSEIPQFITNIISPVSNISKYKIPIHFFDDTFGQPLTLQNKINHNIQFGCSILENFWASAISNLESNELSCIIIPNNSPIFGTKMINSLTLVVSVMDQYQTYKLEYQKVFPFIPAFIIKDKKTSIHFSSNQKKYFLEIQGKIDYVKSSDTSKIKISKKIKNDNDIHVYEIEVIDLKKSFSNVIVELLCRETGQKEIINIFYDIDNNPQPSFSNFISFFNTLANLNFWNFFLLIILIFGGYIFLKLRNFPPTPSPPTPSPFRQVPPPPMYSSVSPTSPITRMAFTSPPKSRPFIHDSNRSPFKSYPTTGTKQFRNLT